MVGRISEAPEKAPTHKNRGMMGRLVIASSKELAQMGPVPPVPAKGAGSVLDFGQAEAESGADSTGTSGADEAPLDLEQLLTTVRETAYRWDFASDRIDWAANAEAVLGVPGIDKIAKGRAYALLVDPEQA